MRCSHKCVQLHCGTGEFPTAAARRLAGELLFAKADCMTGTSVFAAFAGLLDLGVLAAAVGGLGFAWPGDGVA
jgi:hypothetical protein